MERTAHSMQSVNGACTAAASAEPAEFEQLAPRRTAAGRPGVTYAHTTRDVLQKEDRPSRAGQQGERQEASRRKAWGHAARSPKDRPA